MKNIYTQKIWMKIIIAAAILGILSVITFALNGAGSTKPVLGAESKEAVRPVNPPTNTLSVAPAANNEKTPAQVLHFALYDVGVLPREIKIAKSDITLAINNFSGMSGEVNLIKENGNGNGSGTVAGNIENAPRRGRIRREFKLTPGRYWLTMAAKPANKSLIVITANDNQ